MKKYISHVLVLLVYVILAGGSNDPDCNNNWGPCENDGVESRDRREAEEKKRKAEEESKRKKESEDKKRREEAESKKRAAEEEAKRIKEAEAKKRAAEKEAKRKKEAEDQYSFQLSPVGAPAAAPDAAAVDPAAPALPLAPADAELCAKVGTDNDKTKVIVAKILKIRIS